MTIDQAVTFLRNVARNGQDSSMYTAVMVESAIQGICNDFITRTQATRATGDLILAAGTAALPSFGSPAAGTLTGFRTEYLLRAYLVGLTSGTSEGNPNLDITEFGDVMNRSLNRSIAGQPCLLAFDSISTGMVFPTPDKPYTLRLLWDPPFTSWVAGSGGSPVLNLPDEFMQQILRWGATYYLQGNEPENQKAQATNWQNYLDFVAKAKSMGVGTLGKQVEYRHRRGDGPRRIITDHLYH